MVAILSNQREVIFDAVRAMYTAVATSPEKGFHFPTGRSACELVGYPAEELDAIPATAIESFAGVGYPFAAGVIGPGDIVLDVGSGSGTDVLIASHLVGSTGKVYALDMTEAMRAKLRANLELAGATNVEILEANAEEIPLPDASVTVVTSNGVLNLVPDKPRAVAEIYRVLRPRGRVQIADIVLATEPSEACRSHPELWAECVVGATRESNFLEMFRAAGFTDVEVLSHLDYFAASPSAETRKVAASFGARTMVMRAVKQVLGARCEVLGNTSGSEDPGRSTRPGGQTVTPPSRSLASDTSHLAPASHADRMLDAGEMSCGDIAPVVRGALRQLEPGQILAVRSTVPAVGTELTAWCRLSGHEFLGSERDGDVDMHFIRRKQS